MNYVFDTSALIGMWKRTYPPEQFPTLWDKMDELASRGRILGPEEVLGELSRMDDAVHQWAKDRAETTVAPTTRPLMQAVRDLLGAHPYLMKTGRNRNSADPFVIAQAAFDGRTVVTEEKGGVAAKPTIPYICRERRIDCIAPLDFIKEEGWQF